MWNAKFLAVTRRLVTELLKRDDASEYRDRSDGARLFAAPKRSQHLLGSILFWLHSVLDGCDGELARLKFAESRWGGLIDFWGDNLVHSAVFSAIAANLHAEKPGRTPFLLAASAVAGTLLSATLVYCTTMKETISNGRFSPGSSARTRRDHSNSIARRLRTNWRDAISSTW